MRRRLALFLLPLAALLAVPAAHASPTATTTREQEVVCKHVHNARARCLAIRVDRVRRGRVRHSDTPIGYTPADIQKAYSLPTSGGRHQTVAIVDGYDDPAAERDLAVYRAQFGLPACTTANKCFRKVDQDGGDDYPEPDGGWAQEISLDLDMASAACPKCDLLLVEAKTVSMTNLGTAERTAVRLGADAVSNSWGGADAKDRYYGRYFHHPGVAITASSGDSGYGVSYPASSKWVTAVGGTTLARSSSSRGFSETAWTDGGSGCSTDNTTTWQPRSVTGCDGRAVADVAAVADPATGVAVFDSYVFDDTSGWLTFGGTSASSPIIAGIYALAGDFGDHADASRLWDHHSHLHDINDGSNGSCASKEWCHAGRGWDGPTGWGTPDGIADF
ncbi:MAG: S8 family serine peptidase [Frankiaceae bacterium]|nr:S8 family serine peptidase [Frankiaceae bacterium]